MSDWEQIQPAQPTFSSKLISSAHFALTLPSCRHKLPNDLRV